MLSRRNFIHAGLATSAALALPALAQGKRPITILVGFPAGGSPDFVARTLSEKLQARLGRPVIVDNKPGAGGQLALAALQNARPDGTTYVLTPPGMLTVYPMLYPKLPYDVASLEPVIAVCTFDFALATPTTLPAKTLAEFIAWAKANPQKASFGVPGAGTTPHFLGMLLSRAAGIDLQVVPYRGGPPLVADLLGGQIPLAINVTSNFTEYHRAGKLRVLATTGAKRNPLLQEVPTMAELGYKNAESEEWYALVAKAGTPKAETRALSAAAREVVQLREVGAALLASGHIPTTISGDALTANIEANSRRWSELIKQVGFKL